MTMPAIYFSQKKICGQRHYYEEMELLSTYFQIIILLHRY